MNNVFRLHAPVLAAAAIFSATVFAAESNQTPASPGDPYPLATCPVTGKALDAMGGPVIEMIDGREVRFCCAGCPDKVAAEPEKYLEPVDKQIVEAQRPIYPLETCVVSGAELGAMGDPVNYIYRNRLVRLCCAGCIKKLEGDPAGYLAKIDDAVIAARKEAYPLSFCLVSGEKLGDMGEPVDVVMGNRLYRVCCKGCIKSLHASPLKYQAMLDDALAGKTIKRPEESASKDSHGEHDSHKPDAHKHSNK